MNEETENIMTEPGSDSLKGKRVLLIGGSSDLDGRALGASIDADRAGYDLIARVNKDYGTAEDCGSRTDMVFVRRRAWFAFWFARLRKFIATQEEAGAEEVTHPRIVAFWDGVGCPRSYADDAAQELGLPKASTGLLAAKWLREQGADVTVIGFGFSGGSFASEKVYAVTEAVDPNPNYDWPAENEWLRQNVTLI